MDERWVLIQGQPAMGVDRRGVDEEQRASGSEAALSVEILRSGQPIKEAQSVARTQSGMLKGSLGLQQESRRKQMDMQSYSVSHH